MKTIFITSFNPFVTRNILLTDVLATLKKQPELRIVVFCPDYKADYFQEILADTDVSIEPVRVQQATRQDILFHFLGRSLINTSSLRMHRRELFHRNKKFLNFSISQFLSLLGYIPGIKQCVRWLDYLTINTNRFVHYFENYKPDLVFAPDVFHGDDVHFLAEAKKRGIVTVGMVRSWDNITGKGLFRMKPDMLVVNNETIKKEAMRYEGMRAGDIFVGGVPQFDYYLNYQPRASREAFFAKRGLDPSKKLILFIPVGKRFYDGEGKVLRIIQEAINAGELGNAQVLVRFPPNDDVDLSGFSPDSNFAVEKPGRQFQPGIFRDQEMDAEDMARLADSLYYADVLAGYSSSMAIDGAVFGKPFVLVEGFDPDGPRPYTKSCIRFLDYYHVSRFLVENGSTKLSRSKAEMIADIKNYLNNPQLHAEGRSRLMQEQADPLDGKSGERIGNSIASFI